MAENTFTKGELKTDWFFPMTKVQVQETKSSENVYQSKNTKILWLVL